MKNLLSLLYSLFIKTLYKKSNGHFNTPLSQISKTLSTYK